MPWRLLAAALLALAAVLVGDYAYYWWPEVDRPWAGYVGQGIQAAALFGAGAALCRRIPSPAWRFAVSAPCMWGLIEAGQRAICGAILFGQYGGGDLCARIAGPNLYPLAAAVLLATIITLTAAKHGR